VSDRSTGKLSVMRALFHFWPRSLAVALGAAVATAVLTGALVVGDSVRSSLQALTLDRLGDIDLALVAPRFLPSDLEQRLATDNIWSNEVVRSAPLIILRGAGRNPESGALASDVDLYGVDERFASLYPNGPALDLSKEEGQFFPSVAINRSLARELSAGVGDSILLTFQTESEVPSETILGERDAGEILESIRATVVDILPDRGIGGFGLEPTQAVSRNAFLASDELQRVLDQEGRINALVVDSRGDDGEPETMAQSALGRVASVRDFGLRLATAPSGQLGLQNEELVLRDATVAAARSAAQAQDLATDEWLIYLANEIRLGDRSTPYSTVAAVDLPLATDPAGLTGLDGEPVAALREGEILLDAWLAEDLAGKPGGERDLIGQIVELEFFAVGPRDELLTRSAEFTVAGIVAMEGLAADPSLTPELPGIGDTDNMADWDPPFPVDLSVIRPKDEEFWDLYRGAPKAFVHGETGRKLWASRFGEVTTLRFGSGLGSGLGSGADTSSVDAFADTLRVSLDPAVTGLRFLPVRQQGIAASSGASDFNGLFIGFSLFLIVSAALLVGLLFALTVEQRARELGLRLAVGYPLKVIRRQLLGEGAILAVVGALLGTVLAVLYGGAIVRALAGWWAPLLGSGSDTPLLRLAVEPATLAAGAIGSILLVLATIAGTLRRLKKSPARALLAGSFVRRALQAAGRRARWIALASGLGGLVLGGYLAIGGDDANPGLFFLLAALILTLGFALFSIISRRGWGELAGASSLGAMASRNTARAPGRSLLAVVLIGSACFVLVAVAANRRDFGSTALDRDSGTGGFALVGESDIPIRVDLNDAAGRDELALEELPGDETTRVSALRLLPGEDASCLNLYQPEKPRVLGVPGEFRARGGFHFRSTLEERENPWDLLELDLGPGVIPAIGDYASILWILHSGLGKDFPLETESGETLQVRFVGLLEKSIFQSEILISEEQFVRHFPSRGGFGYFLFDGDPELADRGPELEEALADFGLDVQSSAGKLAAYQAVENTYLTTFQVLGGLGLLLGTLGLAIVLIRNVLERQGELATLRAFGYRRRTLAAMVFFENALLLMGGLAIGTVAGLLSVLPHLLHGTTRVPWGSLAFTLLGILAAGMLASLVAARIALRTPLLPALKREST